MHDKNLQPLADPLVEQARFDELLKSFVPFTWITYSLIFISVAIWLAGVAYGADFFQTPTDKLLAWGGNLAYEVQHGAWWRLLVSVFLHGGALHLLMNMIGLASAGQTVERIYGCRIFLLIYMASGIIGSALSLHFAAQKAVSVGASGAVFGIMGALLIGLLGFRKDFPQVLSRLVLANIGIFILYNLSQGLSKPDVDNAAHLGGLFTGITLAVIFPKKSMGGVFSDLIKLRVTSALIVIMMIVSVLMFTAPVSGIEHKIRINNEAALIEGLMNFDKAIAVMEKDNKDLAAGKLTHRERDKKGQKIYAPMFSEVHKELSSISLESSDPRQALFEHAKRFSGIMAELLLMDYVYKNGSDESEPVDQERADRLEVELKKVSSELVVILQKTEKSRQH